jgi:hypothetical protein
VFEEDPARSLYPTTKGSVDVANTFPVSSYGYVLLEAYALGILSGKPQKGNSCIVFLLKRMHRP